MKLFICRWINRRLTFAHIATVAEAAGVDPRSLVLLHPSFNLAEQDERVAA